MNTCSNCQSIMSADKNFCDECGTPIQKAVQTSAKIESEVSEEERDSSASLTLRTWKPWRWLFTEKYGELEILDGNFKWNLYPAWKYPAIKIIAQVFSYGFHVLGYLTHNGFSPIKNVNAIALVSPQWIKWRFTFFIVNSGGFIGVYPIPADDLSKAKAFKQALQSASSQNK